MPKPSLDRPALLARLRAGVDALGLALEEAGLARLIDYLELLARWNAVYNLTAIRDPNDMVAKHLLDSLAIAPYVHGANLVDLGTGAGLPGIPLAILFPARRIALVDSNGKKTRFLREAARALALGNVRIEQARAEDLSGQYDCILARAFAPLADLLRVGGHLLAPGGACLAMKGAIDAAERAGVAPPFRLERIVPLTVPGLEAARNLAIIRSPQDGHVA